MKLSKKTYELAAQFQLESIQPHDSINIASYYTLMAMSLLYGTYSQEEQQWIWNNTAKEFFGY